MFTLKLKFLHDLFYAMLKLKIAQTGPSVQAFHERIFFQITNICVHGV